MCSDVAISVRNLSKIYRIYQKPEHRLIQMATLGRIRPSTEFPALDDISIDIRRGETIGIVGRNGCGKSTLLQVICGTLQPTSGSVQVNGKIAALLELGAGFNPEFTGRDNVYMNGAILGLSKAAMNERFDSIIRFADIGPFIDRPVKTYSSGMFVRLAFAVAINVDPDILIVDEALSVGDEAFQRKCYARIEQIKERGATILFVSHAAQTVAQLCDRAILLDAGEMLLEGEPKAVVGQYQRLVNASHEAAEAIRADIRAMRDGTKTEDRVEAEPPPSGEVSSPAPVEAETASQDIYHDDGITNFLDPTVRSESVVALAERGARISGVRIATPDGRTVNVLRRGLSYIFEYKVHFDKPVREAGFGMWFKNPTGLGLGGAQSFEVRSQRTKSIAAGTDLVIRYRFTCRLQHGVYFCNCGVWGVIGDEEAVLMHRLIDVMAFRIPPVIDSIATGMIDFDPELEVVDATNH